MTLCANIRWNRYVGSSTIIIKDARSVTFTIFFELFLLSNSFNKHMFCQLQVKKISKSGKKMSLQERFLQLIGNFQFICYQLINKCKFRPLAYIYMNTSVTFCLSIRRWCSLETRQNGECESEKKQEDDRHVWQIQLRKGIKKCKFRPLAEKYWSYLKLFSPFLLVHDYFFDDPTSLEYICKDFQVVFVIFMG